jgi:hypothetical protein
MTLWQVLAFVCIVIAFLVAAAVFKLWMSPLEWFVAAIAFNTLGLAIPGVTQKKAPAA